MDDALLRELFRRAEGARAPEQVLASAFDRQLDFIRHPAKLKALFCTRRSAKSFTAGLYLVYEALRNPGANCLFVGLTRASAKDIVWKDILRVIDQRYDLGCSFNQSTLTATFPNGSVVQVTGVDAEEAEMRKLLGRKYRLACVDEASMYTVDLAKLVYGVLGPAMTDPNAGGERGTICLLGTASDFPRGLFYDITTQREPGWKLFTWTAHDNPHVAAQWQEALQDIRENRPLYMQTPQYRQWYLNEWVVDETKLVYRFNPALNLTPALPALAKDGWSYTLGVDLGWEDDNAWVLTQYHQNDPNLYVTRVHRQARMTFDEVADRTLEMICDPRTGEHLPCRVIIDGANKQGVESMRVRSAIPFEAADKHDKVTFIEVLNADLVQGKIKILDTPGNRPLWEELKALVWVTDGDKIKFPKKENPSISNHLADAHLYAHRMGYHFHAAPAERRPPAGSRDWYLSQHQNIWEQERERLLEESGWEEMPPLPRW